MNSSELRHLTRAARKEAEEQRAREERDAAEKKRIAQEEKAEEIIANLRDRVTECAKRGENSYTVLTVYGSELTCRPRERIFTLGDRNYHTDGLPHYAKQIYRYCKSQGLRTRIYGRSTVLSIVVEW